MASPTLFFESLLTSDQIYELGSEQVEKEFTSADGTSYADQLSKAKIRYEANYDALIASSSHSFKATNEIPEENYSTRTIWAGSLEFSGSRLSSLNVTKQISWTAFTDWGQNIIEVKVLRKPFNINDATSKEQWLALAKELQGNSTTTFKYDDVNWIDEQTPPDNTTSVLDFLSLPEAQYFEQGWEIDPTSANVLLDIDLDEKAQTPESLNQIFQVDFTNAISGVSNKQDNLVGGEESDILIAGKGADKLTGGNAADQFVFNTPDRFGKKGADTITDFNPEQGDKLILSPDALPGLSNPELTTVTSKKALKAAQKSAATLIYYEPLGQLFYDQNGSGRGFGKGGLFAVLSGAPALSADDLGLLG